MKTFLILIGLFFAVAAKTQTSYFIDNISGDDQNNGTSVRSAWKTINKANSVLYKPGDSLLFRKGGTWIGNLSPKGKGKEGGKIVIGAYGKGPLPLLDARGIIAKGEKYSYTIRLFNQEYIEIRDLRIRNFKAFENPSKIENGRKTFNVNSKKMGVYIEARDCGTLHDIYLINLEVYDVNGDMSNKDNGGIFIEVTWDEQEDKRIKSNFNGLYTEGCYIHNVDRTGWSNTSVWKNRSLKSKWGELLANGTTHNWFPSRNVVIRNSKFEWTGANALIVRVSDSPLVEHCYFSHNAWKGSGNASFPFNCDNALFQFNEACYTVFNSEADSWDNRKDADAGGFDSDWNCKNTIIQYNYSHHNGFGGVLVCCYGSSETGFNDGTIVRYNIFEDNRHHVIRESGSTTNTKIYNNLIFSGEEQDSVILVYHKNWGGFSDSAFYANNIFYSSGNDNYFDLGKSTRIFFQANLYYGPMKDIPCDPQEIIEDPLFIDASGLNGFKSFMRFLLRENSPAINTGIIIKGHSDRDIIGTPILGKPDRGPFEFRK